MTADLQVIAAHGCFAVSAITALTVQSTAGVRAVHPVEGTLLADTLECLAADFTFEGIKIGMLDTVENVRVVASFLRNLKRPCPVVLDPVVRSSSGRPLLSQSGCEALRDDLLPCVGWVTPNLAELGMLVNAEIRTADEMETGAGRLAEQCEGLNVVVTGGHLDGGADDLVSEAGGRLTWLRGDRIASGSTHGTGCGFSSALVCGLAAGLDGPAAAGAAKRYVTEAIRRAEPVGSGPGPMALLWPLQGMGLSSRS